MTWTSLNWRRDGSAVLLSAVCDEDRTHQNLLLVQTGGSGARTLLDCATKKRVRPAWAWLDDDDLVFNSDETGNRVPSGSMCGRASVSA